MNIQELVAILETQGKNTLANVIASKGSFGIADYSKYLWEYSADITLEPELIQAFKIEFSRLGIDVSIWDEIIQSINKHRTLQTAPHTGLLDSTSVPAFTLHSIALNNIPNDAYYVVGTFSGIPFGNDSYPGVLSWNIEKDFDQVIAKDSIYCSTFKKRQADRLRDVPSEKYNRLSLYENTMRDDLVYKSIIPETFKKIYPSLTGSVKEYLQYKDGDTDFTRVMLNSCQEFSQIIFNNKKIIYIDINEVISNYLTIVLKNPEHFIYKMFFDMDTHKKIMDVWSHDAHFFYDLVDSQNGKKQVHAYVDEFILKNKINEEHITPEILIDKLANSRLCPGVFLGFTILSFLNGFQCFGSFKQVSYLTDYKNTWMGSGLLPHDISNVRTDSLTTGALPDVDARYITAIDMILGSKWDPSKNVACLNDIILPMQERLIGFKI